VRLFIEYRNIARVNVKEELMKRVNEACTNRKQESDSRREQASSMIDDHLATMDSFGLVVLFVADAIRNARWMLVGYGADMDRICNGYDSAVLHVAANASKYTSFSVIYAAYLRRNVVET